MLIAVIFYNSAIKALRHEDWWFKKFKKREKEILLRESKYFECPNSSSDDSLAQQKTQLTSTVAEKINIDDKQAEEGLND
jgi:hypothetical protein